MIHKDHWLLLTLWQWVTWFGHKIVITWSALIIQVTPSWFDFKITCVKPVHQSSTSCFMSFTCVQSVLVCSVISEFSRHLFWYIWIPHSIKKKDKKKTNIKTHGPYFLCGLVLPCWSKRNSKNFMWLLYHLVFV